MLQGKGKGKVTLSREGKIKVTTSREGKRKLQGKGKTKAGLWGGCAPRAGRGAASGRGGPPQLFLSRGLYLSRTTVKRVGPQTTVNERLTEKGQDKRARKTKGKKKVLGKGRGEQR